MPAAVIAGSGGSTSGTSVCRSTVIVQGPSAATFRATLGFVGASVVWLAGQALSTSGGEPTAVTRNRPVAHLQRIRHWIASAPMFSGAVLSGPLPAMTAAGTRTLARGRFYGIDQVGRGRVTIYRLANGRHALRLDNFYVTPNIDLDIRLSPLREPRTTRQYRSAPSVRVQWLDVTTGSMNFLVPRNVDPRRYRSVVIWCQNIISAYAAATLRFS